MTTTEAFICGFLCGVIVAMPLFFAGVTIWLMLTGVPIEEEQKQ